MMSVGGSSLSDRQLLLGCFWTRGIRTIRNPPGATKKGRVRVRSQQKTFWGATYAEAVRRSERHDTSLLDPFSISHQCRANRRHYRPSRFVLTVQKFFYYFRGVIWKVGNNKSKRIILLFSNNELNGVVNKCIDCCKQLPDRRVAEHKNKLSSRVSNGPRR